MRGRRAEASAGSRAGRPSGGSALAASAAARSPFSPQSLHTAPARLTSPSGLAPRTNVAGMAAGLGIWGLRLLVSRSKDILFGLKGP